MPIFLQYWGIEAERLAEKWLYAGYVMRPMFILRKMKTLTPAWKPSTEFCNQSNLICHYENASCKKSLSGVYNKKSGSGRRTWSVILFGCCMSNESFCVDKHGSIVYSLSVEFTILFLLADVTESIFLFTSWFSSSSQVFWDGWCCGTSIFVSNYSAFCILPILFPCCLPRLANLAGLLRNILP